MGLMEFSSPPKGIKKNSTHMVEYSMVCFDWKRAVLVNKILHNTNVCFTWQVTDCIVECSAI